MAHLFAMQRHFRKDSRYLVKYYLTNITLFLAANVALVLLRKPDLLHVAVYAPAVVLITQRRFLVIVAGWGYAMAATFLVFGWSGWLLYAELLLLVPPTTMFASSMLHNAAHNNFPRVWQSRVVGEAAALFHMVGFPDWHIVHNLHHRHSDDAERDPHPPRDLSFWAYLNTMKPTIGNVLTRNFLEIHAGDPNAIRRWKQLGRLIPVNQIVRAAFWFLVLGPQVFAFFYAGAIVGKNLSYAHFNYATHAWVGDHAELKNLNHNLWYKFANKVGFGLYYHRNHHDRPHVFNPANAALSKRAPRPGWLWG